MSRDPKKVYKDGISLKIKIPDIVAKIKLKYLIGVTFDTSACLIDFVRNIFQEILIYHQKSKISDLVA